MFAKARLKLTAWYVLIITIISLFFSIGTYNTSIRELDNLRKVHVLRLDNPSQYFKEPPQELRRSIGLLEKNNIESIDNAKERILLFLVFINIGIISLSSLLGYFLAGRTLAPIKENVEKQNRFIQDASHELRTPLTSLKSEIEVSLRDKKLNISEAKKLLTSNLEEVNNLQYLTDNLLKMNHLNNPKTVAFEFVDLKTIVEKAIKKVQVQAYKRKIFIVSKIENIQLKADAPSIIELLVILLDNAIKYSKRGSEVKIISATTNFLIKISVIDQGGGIPKEDLPHIFERFYRANKSRTKDNTPGYGLGLSIAQEIVEKHQGEIKVETGKSGSTFIIELPK